MPSKGIGPTALGLKIAGEVSPRRKAGARKQHDWMEALAAATVPNQAPQISPPARYVTRDMSSGNVTAPKSEVRAEKSGAIRSLANLVGRTLPAPSTPVAVPAPVAPPQVVQAPTQEAPTVSPALAQKAPAPRAVSPSTDTAVPEQPRTATATAPSREPGVPPKEQAVAPRFVQVHGIEVTKLPVEAREPSVVKETIASELPSMPAQAPRPVAAPVPPRTSFPFAASAPRENPKAEIAALPLRAAEEPVDPSSPEPVAKRPTAEGPARRLPFVTDGPGVETRVDAPRLDAPVVRAYAEHRAQANAEMKQAPLPEAAPRHVESRTAADTSPDRGSDAKSDTRGDARPGSDPAPSREVARASAPTETTAPASRAVAPAPAPTQPAAPELPTLRDLAPLPHEALAQTILTRARALPENGAVELRFALDPPDLGAVHVKIEARGHEVRIQIETATHAAAGALAPGLAKLTTELHAAGYPDPQISLGTSPEHGQRETSPNGRNGASPEQGQRETSPKREERGYKRREAGILDRTA